MKVLLVTIAIGYKYLEEYEKLFKESQRIYAEKHGYDFRVITDYLDPIRQSRDTISFNKILVCCQEWSANYDFIIFVDADILINRNAPAIHTSLDFGDCIGIVDEYSQPSKEKRLEIQKQMGWELNATAYYKLSEFDLETDKMLNSGVLVCQPKIHGEFLRIVYEQFLNICAVHPRGFHYEQSCIGYILQKTNCYKVLDNKFNALWGIQKITNDMDLETFFQRNYFIHFAGRTDFDRVEGLHKFLS